MKFYNTNLTLQNFGSAYLLILRGTTKDIKEGFNSFFNWGGVSSNATIDLTENPNESIGVFWSNERALIRYWLNRYLIAHPERNEKTIFAVELNERGEPNYEILDGDAMEFIANQIAEMRSNSEKFMTFTKSYVPAEHGIGRISAERPDHSFLEAAHVHVTKKQQETEV